MTDKTKQKKILKLNRRIAALNGRKGFAFDVPKGLLTTYNDHRKLKNLLTLSRRLLSYFDGPIDSLSKFTVLINTSDGVYRLDSVVNVTKNLESDAPYIKIVISSPPVLQKVKVFGFKILDSCGRCIYVSKRLVPVDIRIGDTFSVTYDIET